MALYKSVYYYYYYYYYYFNRSALSSRHAATLSRSSGTCSYRSSLRGAKAAAAALADALWRQRQIRTDKKLSYRRGTARCVLSVVILPVATQQCRNYLYDKS